MHNFRWKWIGYYVISNLLLAAGHFVLMWAVLQAQEIEVAAAEFFAFALAAAAGTFILAVIFGYEFSKSLHSKLQDITAGVKTLAYGDLSFR
ncbi:MAG TPA: hypothetical protein VJ064_06885, partial [Limnochordia bacterium]|nr:hypothetical protein [Limnochordia bacterium]